MEEREKREKRFWNPCLARTGLLILDPCLDRKPRARAVYQHVLVAAASGCRRPYSLHAHGDSPLQGLLGTPRWFYKLPGAIFKNQRDSLRDVVTLHRGVITNTGCCSWCWCGGMWVGEEINNKQKSQLVSVCVDGNEEHWPAMTFCLHFPPKGRNNCSFYVMLPSNYTLSPCSIQDQPVMTLESWIKLSGYYGVRLKLWISEPASLEKKQWRTHN